MPEYVTTLTACPLESYTLKDQGCNGQSFVAENFQEIEGLLSPNTYGASANAKRAALWDKYSIKTYDFCL